MRDRFFRCFFSSTTVSTASNRSFVSDFQAFSLSSLTCICVCVDCKSCTCYITGSMNTLVVFWLKFLRQIITLVNKRFWFAMVWRWRAKLIGFVLCSFKSPRGIWTVVGHNSHWTITNGQILLCFFKCLPSGPVIVATWWKLEILRKENTRRNSRNAYPWIKT